MAELEFRDAVRDALDEELSRDESVVFFGEDVGRPGGVFAVTGGLQERHGAARVFDTPISELAIAGAAFGAAISGLRPIIEIMFGDFLFLAMDSLPTRRPSTSSSPTSRRASRSSSAPRSAPAVASVPSIRRCRCRGFRASPA